MIFEPHIAVSGPRAGLLDWLPKLNDKENTWVVYADFERKKLKELVGFLMVKRGGYQIVFLKNGKRKDYVSSTLTGYTYDEYKDDSEALRILKRAEFMKGVCEEQNIAWLDDIAWCHCKNPRRDGMHQTQGKCELEKPFILKPVSEDDPSWEKCGHCGVSTDRFDPCCQKWIDDQTPEFYGHPNCKTRSVIVKVEEDKPERDYYTKEEMDERMDAIITFTEMKLMCTRGPTCEECKGFARDLRKRFLP